MTTLPAIRPYENVEDAFALIASHRQGAELDFAKPNQWHRKEMLVVTSVDANGRDVLCFCDRKLDTLPGSKQVVPVYHRVVMDRVKALEGIQDMDNWVNLGSSLSVTLSGKALNRLSEIIRNNQGEIYDPTMSLGGSTLALRVLAQIARND